MEPFVRSAYNYDVDAASLESAVDCNRERGDGEPIERTKQSFKEEVDINTIVRRFGLTGQLPPEVAVPQFGDFENVVDFHTAMLAVRGAQEKFDALPAEMRFRFANDPNELLYFLGDEKNRDEAVKLGLLKPPAAAPEAPEPLLVRLAPESSPAPGSAPTKS